MPDPAPWYVTLVSSFGAPSAVMAVFFWWATNKLIPQLQQERRDAITSFQSEMDKERTAHSLELDKLLRVHEKAVDGMLAHMGQDHAETA